MMVPPLIHCIWLGSIPPNDQERPHRRRLVEWVEQNPSWSVWLWTDRQDREWNQLEQWCQNTGIVLKSVQGEQNILWGNERDSVHMAIQQSCWATASDLLRLRILYQCGGLYVDSDVEPIQVPQFELPLGIGMILREDRSKLISVAPHMLAAMPGHSCLQIALWKGVANIQLLDTSTEQDFRFDTDPIKRYGGTLVLTGDLLRPALLQVEGVFSSPDLGWSPWLESMRLPFSAVHKEETQWLNAQVLHTDVFFPPGLSMLIRQSWSIARLTSILHWIAAYGPAWLIEHACQTVDPFQDYFGHSPRGVATLQGRDRAFVQQVPSI